MSDTTARLKRPLFTIRLPDGRRATAIGMWRVPQGGVSAEVSGETLVVCQAEGDPMLTIAHPSCIEKIQPTGAQPAVEESPTSPLRRWADPRWRK